MPLTVGELVAFLDLDANPFTKGLDRAFADAEQSGKKMQNVGKDMTKYATLPILAAGAAAVKLGTDFDTAFGRMVGLAGVPAGEVDELKDKVLDLAGETAVAPQELADALYFAASAGLDAAGAMDAVTYAAKASAAGMGNASEIVGLTASAVASYGEGVIDAARATDILTASVRAGRADPTELASTLGRVLPVAAQLGVSFEEVGGTVAYLSNIFGDTNRTVTSLSGLLVKLVSPTQQGRQALADMGTSVEELQAAIREDGLVGALELLREKGFAGNQQALRALFDDIEGYQGALALLNDESGSLAETLDEVAGSSGALDEAFDAAQTDGKKITQALVDLQVAAIKASETIAPFAASVASGISDVSEAFGSLPGPAQNVIMAMVGILAATGPVLSIGGKLLTNFRSITSGAETLALRSMYLSDRLGGLKGALTTLGFAGAVAGAILFAKSLSDTEVDVEGLATALGDLADAQNRQGVEETVRAAAAMGELDTTVRKLADSNVIAAERFVDTAAAMGIEGEQLEELRAIVDAKRDSDVQGAKDQAAYSDEVAAAAGATDELTGALGDEEQAAEDAAEAIDEFKAALDRAFAPLDRQAAEDQYTSALRGIGDHFTEAADRVDDAKGRLGDAKQRLAELQATPGDERSEDHGRQVAEAREAIADAEADLAEAIDGTSRALEGNSAQAIANRALLDDAVRSAGDVLTAMKEQGASDEELAAKKDELLWRLALEAEAYGLNQDEIRTYTDLIGAIPITKSTTLLVNADGAFQTVKDFLAFLDAKGISGQAVTGHTSLLGFKQDQLLEAHTGGAVPGPAAQDIPMTALGGEPVRTIEQEAAA